MSMTAYTPTDRTKVRRRPDRGSYDRALVHSIIDEALVAHVGFVVDGWPRVIPTSIVRIGEEVFIHGSPNNQMLTTILAGEPACLEITLVDSIVAGRSGFGCSMDYRSVVIFGRGEKVESDAEKEKILDATIRDLIPGHQVRRPKQKELDATVVVRFRLDEVSAKVRDKGNIDVDEDYEQENRWAGIIPIRVTAGAPVDCPRLKPGIATPDYAKAYKR